MTDVDGGPRGMRSARLAWAAGGVAVVLALVALGFGPIGTRLVAGPLDTGNDVWVSLPLDETAEGAVWATPLFMNHTSEPIVMRSVTIRYGGGDLELLSEPALWGPGRHLTASAAHLISGFYPLPEDWASLERHPIPGYVIDPAPADPAPDEPPYTDAELVVEFAVPDEVSSVLGLDVTYDTGGRRYTERITSVFTVCPPDHIGECEAQREP